jgi:hypothetical protein
MGITKLRFITAERPTTRMNWTAEFPKDLRQLEAALRSGRV